MELSCYVNLLKNIEQLQKKSQCICLFQKYQGILFRLLSSDVQNVQKKGIILYVLQDPLDLITGKTIILHRVIKIQNLWSDMHLILLQLVLWQQEEYTFVMTMSSNLINVDKHEIDNL